MYIAELDGRRVRLESQRVHDRRALFCQARQGDQVLTEYINPLNTDLASLPNEHGLSVRAVVAHRVDQFKVKRDNALAAKCAYMQRQACQGRPGTLAERARRNRQLKALEGQRAKGRTGYLQSVGTPSTEKDPQND